MVGAMTSVAKMGMELTVEERNLLSVAFKMSLVLEELLGELLVVLNKKKKVKE